MKGPQQASDARAVARAVLDRLEVGCGIEDKAAAARVVQEVVGFAQDRIIANGGVGGPEQIGALLQASESLILGYGHCRKSATYEAVAGALTRMASVHVVGEHENCLPESPYTVADYADAFVTILRQAEIDLAGVEEIAFSIIGEARERFLPFGGEPSVEKLVAIMMAAQLLVRAKTDFARRSDSWLEEIRAVLAAIQRQLHVRAVPAAGEESGSVSIVVDPGAQPVIHQE